VKSLIILAQLAAVPGPTGMAILPNGQAVPQISENMAAGQNGPATYMVPRPESGYGDSLYIRRDRYEDDE